MYAPPRMYYVSHTVDRTSKLCFSAKLLSRVNMCSSAKLLSRVAVNMFSYHTHALLPSISITHSLLSHTANWRSDKL